MSPQRTAPSRTLTEVRSTGTHAELLAAVRSAGLLDPRPGYYAGRIAINLALLAGCWAVFGALGESWWQLAVAAVLGMVLLQCGFLGHDAGHRQITRSRRAAEVLGLIHLNLLLGAANGWWVHHHNQHHSEPNNLDRDPDTVRRQVIFDVAELAVKGRTAWHRFVIRFQRVLFFVLLPLEAWRVRTAGFRLARAGRLPHAPLELGLVGVHIGLFGGAVLWVLPIGQALAFVLVSQVVLGVGLGAVFAPNHKGMPVYRDGAELDWLRRQVLTARNIRSGRVLDFLFGGLNYQIEHHLFPGMPRVNLRRARPIVRSYCARHAIPYTEVSLVDSYRAVARFLGDVSRRARAPEVQPCE